MPQSDKQWLGINWQMAPNSGWGVLAFNLALEAERDERFLPVPLVQTIYPEHFPTKHQPALKTILARERTALGLIEAHSGQDGKFHCEFPVLHSLGNWFGWESAEPERVRGSSNLGIIFLEEAEVNSRAIERSKRYDRILAGSTWNLQLLRRHGITHSEVFLQGIDPTLFALRPKAPPVSAQFRIFSGGKLEFRKGQDIVVEAFRRFRKRCPGAILMTAWHNPWPATVAGIERRGYVTGVPKVKADGKADIASWMVSNGIPASAIHDFGAVPNHLMPRIYAQTDLAVFPNRCEGGTNLVAMECLASGVPTVLSANTGHLDLVDETRCYPLTTQRPVEPIAQIRGTDGWGESDPNELAELMERAYADREGALKRGAAAAEFMKPWSWENRFRELAGHLDVCHRQSLK